MIGLLKIILGSVVLHRKPPANGKYPTISLTVRKTGNGPSVVSQGKASSQKPLTAAPQPSAPSSVDPATVPSSDTSEVRNIQVIARAQALFDFPGEDEGDLPFKVGDIINVIEYCKCFSVLRLLFKLIVDAIFVLANSNLSGINVIVNKDWWRGILRKDVGIFPTAYVQEL